MDLGYVENEFTWWNRRDGQASMEECLDRFYGDVEWVARFPSFGVSHLDEKVSYHLTITLDNRPTERRKKRVMRRRFEMMWVNDDRCDKAVEDSWANVVSGNAVLHI